MTIGISMAAVSELCEHHCHSCMEIYESIFGIGLANILEYSEIISNLVLDQMYFRIVHGSLIWCVFR